jgi:hypothetical protein
MNNRKLFTKYHLGNAIFWMLCATVGFVSYSFLSFTFQFLYELFDKNASYHLFSAGIALFITGLTFFILRKIKPNLGFRSLVWTLFITLLLIYWGGFFANAFPRISLYIFVPVYFLISFLLLLFVVSWKRFGGLAMVSSFLLGIFASGALSYFYGDDFGFLAMAVRGSAGLFLVFTTLYLFGFFGIFKTRLLYVGVLSVILMLSVLYPLDTENSVEEFKRFKWEKNKTVVGADYEYIGSYRTVSRNIDVFMKNSSDNEEMRFLENGSLSPYSYPMQEKYRFAFYVLLIQNKLPKNILAVGDIPSGLVNVFDNFSKIEKIDYLPVDPLYPEFWANFIHDDMFQNIRIQSSYSELKKEYDLVLLFPPYIKGVGAAPYVGKEQFRRLKQIMNASGSFAVVTPNDIQMLDAFSHESLTGMFKQVKTISLASGLSFTEASDEQGNLTTDPAAIKYRLLAAGIKKDYAEVKGALDSGRFFEKESKANPSSKDSVRKKVLFQYLFIITLLVLVFFAFLYRNMENSRVVLSYTGGVLMFAVLGAVFGIYALAHQRMFVDLNVFFPFILSVLLLACGIGLLLGLWMKIKFNMLSMFLTGTLLFLIPMLYKCFFASVYIGKNDTIFMSLMLGVSSLLIFGTKLWNDMNINISNMVQLLGATLIGLGIGLVVAALFDYNMLSIARTDQYFMFTALCIVGLFAAQIKFKGEIE